MFIPDRLSHVQIVACSDWSPRVQTVRHMFTLTRVSRGADTLVAEMTVDTACPMLTLVGHTVVHADVTVLARPACTHGERLS